ncbi:flagellar hook protein FlgE [Rhodospirillum centenum]|uniref:Flagellar hook protein FlgE n=1 Tax=Rhodospirillum centenum (strain ATCC 51521 / SW) TaxID=414684 RepID=B6IQC5_RHOCS|nr:flagellar hook protein FlgE [Rhodospirillum centenum]ACI97661.1 flagellar hook protein FlgE [Rhodospirillum centenum SW]
MSIYSAMYSGVSGLAAQSAKFAAISDNISNSSTVGYKRSGVQFSTLVTSASSPGSYSAGGVQADLHTEVSRGGIVQATNSATDMAISGRGFFVVSNRSAAVNGEAPSYMLTRSGAFRVDENGNLHNTAGYFLQGWKLGPDGKVVGGEPSRTSFTGLETVNLSSITGLAKATTQIDFAANLPASQTGKTPPAQPFSTSVDYYTPLGGTGRLTLEWAPQSAANEWNLTIYDGTTSLGTANIVFNGNTATSGPPGSLNTMSEVGASPTLDVDAATGSIKLDVNGQPIVVNLGRPNQTGGLTQWGDDYVPTKINKDGASYAPLERVEIGDDGVMTAIYKNGLRQAVYQIPVADVTNPDGLRRMDGNAFQVSRESGDYYLWDAGSGKAGAVDGAALEASNVDIAEELTSIIETQRAYSSNAKIIQTADEMLDEVSRLMR